MATGYIRCPEHGDLYRQPGLTGSGDAMEAALTEPLMSGVPAPVDGVLIACPFCGRDAMNGLEKYVAVE